MNKELLERWKILRLQVSIEGGFYFLFLLFLYIFGSQGILFYIFLFIGSLEVLLLSYKIFKLEESMGWI